MYFSNKIRFRMIVHFRLPVQALRDVKGKASSLFWLRRIKRLHVPLKRGMKRTLV
jgi:hypothetical protein